jgi:hypothetical protein
MIRKLTESFKSIIGEKHEITESIREALEDRVVSPFYGYFIVSWLLVNWNYIYVALFTSSESILQQKNLLRDEYLFQEVLPSHLIELTYWLDFFVLPFILTFVAFWFMPLVTRIFFRQHIKNKIINEGIRAEEMAAEINAEERVLEAEVSKAKVEHEAEQTDPKILWQKHFQNFKQHKVFSKFDKLIKHFYEYNGFIAYNDNWTESRLDQDILVYSDVNGLIEIDENTFILTQKGKAFVKYYSDEK